MPAMPYIPEARLRSDAAIQRQAEPRMSASAGRCGPSGSGIHRRPVASNLHLRDWLSSHVSTMEYFGSVQQKVVPDNLRSGVCRASAQLDPTHRHKLMGPRVVIGMGVDVITGISAKLDLYGELLTLTRVSLY